MMCEIDPAARSLLKKWNKGVWMPADIASVKSLPPDTEVVFAGFPCTDVSPAGRRQGMDGEVRMAVKQGMCIAVFYEGT